jgi:hypothetical protein
MAQSPHAVPGRGFGPAWLLLCVVFGLHVWDEAAHDFLSYYNATVLTLHGHFWWFPRMDFPFRAWLTGLLVALTVCFLLTPFAFRNARWLRPLAYLFAGIQFMNGMGHTLAQIFGRTAPSVRFEEFAPGFYTAPLLLVSSAYLFWSLRETTTPPADPAHTIESK